MSTTSSSLVYNPTSLQTAWDLITNAQKITLLTHSKPDADGASACAALDHILRSMHKQTETVYPTPVTRTLTYQAHTVHIQKHTFIPDLIIVCDTANPERMYSPDVFKNIPLINIDHHLNNSINGTINFVDTSEPSACNVLYNLLQSWNPSLIDIHVATCLLFGILYDTQVFRTQATNASTLQTASKLIEHGAQLFPLVSIHMGYKNPNQCKLWGHLLAKLATNSECTFAWVHVTKEDLAQFNQTENATEGLSNFLWSFVNADVTAVFTITADGKSDVSLRSKTIDVNTIAQKLGGGGHKHASGITSTRSIQEIIDIIAASL